MDYSRLHVDAFPSRPMRGRRFMLLFSNINPGRAPRVWNVGEPFAEMAGKILPRDKEPMAVSGWFKAATFQTRGVRSAYDNLMLGLHDEAKLDLDYQNTTSRPRSPFRLER